MILKIITAALILSSTAMAAQVGRINVDLARVYQYPKGTSRVLSSLKKGESVPVSNVATEGFYKVRLPSGELGWVSGNDLLATAAPENPTASSAPSERMRQKLPRPRPLDTSESAEDRTRILFGGGLQNLSFDGLSANFQGVDRLNLGTNLGLEVQFAIASWLHWAARVDGFFGSSGEQNLNNGSTQTLKYRNIPLQLGLVLTPLQSKRFRFSLGAYGGASVSSSVSVHQVSSTTTGDITYSSVDPAAMANVQLAYGLGNHFGFFAEGAYRYQQTANLPATTTFGPIPSFKINYTGVFGRIGIQMRF